MSERATPAGIDPRSTADPAESSETVPRPSSRAPSAKRGEAKPLGESPATPMMAQYLAIKRAHPDCLLFYRMGDFYELFFEDAVEASKALDITLTRRSKHEGQDVPMCGVPVHASETYLARLIRRGFKVAVCEQVEDPEEARRRGSKSLVKREVVRLVTSGTLTEETLLDARRNNFLAALADAQGELALAWLDMSTGDFQVQPLSRDRVAAALARVEARELLMPERLLQRPELAGSLAEWASDITAQPNSLFDSENAKKRLEAVYQVKALDAFGNFGRAELAAAGALIDYVELTQKGRLPRLRTPRRLHEGAVMEIDAATRRNLELSRNLSGERTGSLLHTIDRTVTGAGARLLTARLAAPLTDAEDIGRRLDAVQFFAGNAGLREKVRERMKRCPDIERSLSRLTLGRGGPRDLAAIRDGLAQTAALRAALEVDGLVPPPAAIRACVQNLGDHEDLVQLLGEALAAELPASTRDGGFIAKGFRVELDETRALRDESRRLIANLQRRYASEANLRTLKIRHNNILGYYVEVKPAEADRLAAAKGPEGQDGFFIHRQTLASAVRFTTTELVELEGRISRAADRALALELRHFDELAGEVTGRAEAIALAADALAALDVAAALAELAAESRYSRPVVDDGATLRITGGRHAVVEAVMNREQGGAFVANDCDLTVGDGQEDSRLWLVTGPNMAGKSTFLRQNALIAILAQMGSFVPAERAHIGVVDRLFSRVGAADDLARGRSTFMVEMVETAAILNQAGPRALVILDEIGRGTATFDGLSIAWATIEHLHEVNRCRTLFATHFHELTALAAKLPYLSNHTMRIKEWRGEVVFLHEVASGAVDRSYGIHVAKLAGLPPTAIRRAEQVLGALEGGEKADAVSRLADDLPLFSTAVRQADAGASAGPGPAPNPLAEALNDVNPDTLTPKEALELLYRLKGLVKD